MVIHGGYMNIQTLILLVTADQKLIDLISCFSSNCEWMVEHSLNIQHTLMLNKVTNYSCIIIDEEIEDSTILDGIVPVIYVDKFCKKATDLAKIYNQGVFDVANNTEDSIVLAIHKAIKQREKLLQLQHSKEELDIKLSERTIQLNSLINTDLLTGLPNSDSIRKTIMKLVSEKKLFSMILFKLNGLQELNVNYGVEMGDNILKQIVARINKFTSNKDIIFGRYLSNVFCLIVNNPKNTNNIVIGLLESLVHPIGYLNLQHQQSICAGVYTCDDKQDWKDVFRRSEIALNSAKNMGKNSVVTFNLEMIEKQIRRKELERLMKESIKNNFFTLNYQPIYNKNRVIIGFEALLRWKTLEFGHISPIEFIPIAEETGMIVELGKCVIRTATQQLKKWHDSIKFKIKPFIAVNISAMQFADHMGLMACVIESLNETKLPAECLKLEITESLLMETGGEASIDALKRIKNIGVKIAIDDFGTGYSSLSYLSKFPIDTLKIDRSFITLLEDSTTDRDIVKTIISLSKCLNLNIVAEGVETDIQFELLKKLGCGMYQGYLLSKPLDNINATNLLQNS